MPIRHCVLALALLTLGGLAPAQDAATTSLSVGQPWSRATAASAIAGAIYLTIANGGVEADTLLAASADVAKSVELHAHTRDAQGVMHMGPVSGVPVPAHGIAELKPGGLHIMLIGLTRPLHQGDRIPLVLTFAHGGAVRTEAVVLAPDAMGPEPLPGTPPGAAKGVVEKCPLCDPK